MQEFSQFPWFGKGDVVFVEQLLKESQDIDELRRFFGAYAYIAETIRDAGGEKPVLTIPATVPRLKVQTAPFSKAELQTITDYDKHYTALSDYTRET
jgi:hypothetical protein